MRALRTISAIELIEALQELPEDAMVAFSSDYGDHCHTKQVLTIEGQIEEETLYETAYSDSGLAIVRRDDDFEKESEETQKCYIIS